MYYGYAGKILSIDLSSGKITKAETNKDMISKFMGCKGFGVHLLFKNSIPKLSPFHEDNPLIFATGPFTGTQIPSTCKVGVFSKSPQTNLLGESYMGSDFGARLKFAGYDCLVITGRSKEPSYISIIDDEVTILSAAYLWGLDAWDTTDAMKEEAGEKASVACIGPAGENLVVFSCITGDYGRQAGRTGMGAVMGSKNLKGIAVKGTNDLNIADQRRYMDLVEQMQKDCLGPLFEGMRRYGTPRVVDFVQGMEALPTRNWQTNKFDGAKSINAEAISSHIEKKKTCFSCPVACSNITRFSDGKNHELYVEGPEFQTICSFGSNCGISDIETIMKANQLCDRLGLDTISTGSLIALTMEASERDLLDQNELSGKMGFGDSDALLRLIQDIGYRKGIGDDISKGIIFFSKKFGIEKYAIHVKGLELPGYDCRSFPGMAIGYAVSGRGGCHLRSLALFDVDLKGDRFAWEGKGEEVVEAENFHTLLDTFPFCKFLRNIAPIDILQALYLAVSGIDFGEERMMYYSERIKTLERLYNIREGLTSSMDSLPPRLFEETKEIKDHGKCVLDKNKLEKAVREYYSARGWDEEGKPTNGTLETLGLEGLKG